MTAKERKKFNEVFEQMLEMLDDMDEILNRMDYAEQEEILPVGKERVKEYYC